MQKIANRADWQVTQSGQECSPNLYFTGAHVPITQGFNRLGYAAAIYAFETGNNDFYASAVSSNSGLIALDDAIQAVVNMYDSEHRADGRNKDAIANVEYLFATKAKHCMKITTKEFQPSLVSDRLAERHGWSRVSGETACKKASGGRVVSMYVSSLEVPDAYGRTLGVAVGSAIRSPQEPYGLIANIGFDSQFRSSLNTTIDNAVEAFDSSPAHH